MCGYAHPAETWRIADSATICRDYAIQETAIKSLTEDNTKPPLTVIRSQGRFLSD
nr:MAG TPA: hypothetical protein [Caudoviricetes sp.]